ncbi:hypothetical protein [Hyphomicrobium sp.]|uniref:hypothetical protein n=1 Tax=Hyphomicrobium sp. TaxID=82 RepID=UPI001D50D4FE|nr:hypothetical protein [Hyphomicrobium sp.]MBY0561441.1 hypothetical protein [Hyphomicrobium sp.]
MSEAQTEERPAEAVDEEARNLERNFFFDDEMPPPTMLVYYKDGSFGPVMFHYAVGNETAANIVKAYGFKMLVVSMKDDIEAGALNEAWARGELVLAEWIPPAMPGWELVARNNSEDGPFAVYLTEDDEIEEPGEPVPA